MTELAKKTPVDIVGTDAELRALRPGNARRDYGDADVRNLRIRVMPSGLISFALLVRPKGGNTSRRRLGDYGRVTREGSFQKGRLTLKQARALARDWNAKFLTGADPRAEALAAAEKTKAEKQSATKFADAVDTYVTKRVASRLRRANELERQLSFFTDAWPTKPLAKITADDIEELLESKSKKHPAMARNLFATLRAMFNWAARNRAYRPLANPCDSVDTGIFEAKSSRPRILNHDELRLLARNIRRMPYPFGALYRVLLLTGLRLNEAARAEWREIDFENRIWEIPASRMKGKLPHVVPITPDLFAILKSIRRSKKAVYVFSTTAGASPVSGFSKVKARLSARMVRSFVALARKRRDRQPLTIEGWTNHDIRRTFRTELSAMGNAFSHEVKEALIAHTKKGIHGVYDRHAYLEEKRAALPLWADRFRTILAAPIGDLEKFRAEK